MHAYEKLGVFYLGRHYDLKARQTLSDPVLYNSNELRTHALCVGMTGSGKTGLCFDMIEEAAIDGIPAILIDPKGDSANQRPDCRPGLDALLPRWKWPVDADVLLAAGAKLLPPDRQSDLDTRHGTA